MLISQFTGFSDRQSPFTVNKTMLSQFKVNCLFTDHEQLKMSITNHKELKMPITCHENKYIYPTNLCHVPETNQWTLIAMVHLVFHEVSLVLLFDFSGVFDTPRILIPYLRFVLIFPAKIDFHVPFVYTVQFPDALHVCDQAFAAANWWALQFGFVSEGSSPCATCNSSRSCQF